MGIGQRAVEGLEVNSEFWRSRRVLVTGHTGFKGSWLCLWLQQMGAEVSGYALPPPTTPSLFEVAGVGAGMTSHLGDIRDASGLNQVVVATQPEIIFHLAAQPLVGYSYEQPAETFATNVMGTVHLLEAARRTPGVRAVVNVTSDKCYLNKDWDWPYREDDHLGGADPYSCSKACAELVARAYTESYLRAGNIALASARAGNVIGGGDWAEARLVPDALRAFERGVPLELRNPRATRPWQHVLEPLSGYLQLGQRLFVDGHAYAEPWNFGPSMAGSREVQWIVQTLTALWGSGEWKTREGDTFHEARQLAIDSSKARARLGWKPRWTLEQALAATVEWHSSWVRGEDMRAVTVQQILRYVDAEASAR